MTRNSDLRLGGREAAATDETLKGGFAPAMAGPAIKALFAGRGQSQPLRRASIAALAVYFVGAGLTCMAQLVIARIIGPESYGVYAYVLAWVTMLAYLSTLGFHVSLLRFVPAYQVKEEWALVRGVIQYSQRGAAGTAITVVLVGVCSIVALNGSLRPELALTFLIGIAAVPFLTLHFIVASVVRAFGAITAALAPERIVRDGLLLLIVAAVFWGDLYRLDATLAMGATLFSSIAMLGLVCIFLRRLRPPALDHARPTYTPGDWWRPTLPLTVIMIADNLMSRSAVISLGLVGNTRDAGIFALAFNMAILISLPRMAVATAFAPTVSALFAREDRTGLQTLSANAACLSLLGSACVAIPLILLARPLLAWFGHDFEAGAPILTILALGQVFAAACGPQQHLITMTGHERAGAAILAVCAASSFAGCIFMIRWFGMTGAAFATTAALVGWNVAMGIFIQRGLHLMPGLAASFKTMPRLWI